MKSSKISLIANSYHYLELGQMCLEEQQASVVPLEEEHQSTSYGATCTCTCKSKNFMFISGCINRV